MNALLTAATRIQLVLNGMPIRHKQILELQPGKYPLLLVLRMAANWGQIEPNLGPVSDEHVALGKKLQADADAFGREQAKLKAGGVPKPVLIRKASELTREERAKVFWIPDKEPADAWVKLHTPKAQ